MSLVLRLGAIAPSSLGARRSAIRWLAAEGAQLAPGDPIGVCHVSFETDSTWRLSAPPLAGERTLQVVLAAPDAGRLRRRAEPGGGHLDLLAARAWAQDEVFAELVQSPGAAQTEAAARRLMLAGSRMAWAVDSDESLLPGWNARARAWWGESAEAPANLLVLGVCDATGFVRGGGGFAEMFAAAPFAAHLIHHSEHPLAPCVPALLDQLDRSPAEREAIAEDVRAAVAASRSPPDPDDLVFLGALLRQLTASPLEDRCETVTPGGIVRHRPASGLVLLSAIAEPQTVLRHRRLGYRAQVYEHDLRAAGPLAQAWMDQAFVREPRRLDDIFADFAALAERVRARWGGTLTVVNCMSTSGRESVNAYAGFDGPLAETLESVRGREINARLDDLAREGRLLVLDLDALAAELGCRAHLPDGVHQSAHLQAALREDLLRLMAGAGGLNVGAGPTRGSVDEELDGEIPGFDGGFP